VATKENFYGIIVVLLAALIATSSLAAFYYVQYNQEAAVAGRDVASVRSVESRYGAVMASNLFIDFGNGTRHWYNGTRIQPGWNLYTETLAVTNGKVNATCCAFGSHFVTGIEGVQSTPGSRESWSVWTFNSTSSWQEANVGVDELGVSNDSVHAWTFCPYNPVTYAPTCSP
jgi:hypothetical protein